jgi:hypothetical protein
MCHLVGKSNGHDLERSPRQQLRQHALQIGRSTRNRAVAVTDFALF